MSETAQIINIIVLIAIIWYALSNQSKRDAANKNQAEIEQWERGAEVASQNQEYMAFVNDTTGLGENYDSHKWYFKMPDSALKHLEMCFEGDRQKVNGMKRVIELSIEHFAEEMVDDAECAKIIEKRVYSNPQSSQPFDSEKYMQYRKEREQIEGEFESFNEWKERKNTPDG